MTSIDPALDERTAAAARRAAASLPDAPRWIDIRGMLLSAHVSVSGGTSLDTGFVVRLVHGARSAVGVVGHPPVAAIGDAVTGVTGMTPVIAQENNASHVDRALASASNEPGSAPTDMWHGERM